MWSICCRRWSTGRWWSPKPGPDGVTRYRLLETLRQYGEQALAADSSTATMRDRHLAHFLGRAEHWCAQQCTADEPEANRAFAANWDNLRAAFDWALATGRGRDVADLLYTTYWFAVHTGRWEHRDWAIAARAAGADTGQIASAAVVLWGALAGQSDTVTEALAALDPAAPDLLARDVEQIWVARANDRVHDQRSRRDRTSGRLAARTGAALRQPDHRSMDPRQHHRRHDVRTRPGGRRPPAAARPGQPESQRPGDRWLRCCMATAT